MPLPTIEPLILKASAKHTATLIFAHGLGDSGEGWRFFAQQFAPRFKYVKWVLPTAPQRPFTLNGGMVMNAWFDATSRDWVNHKDNEEGLRESAGYINKLITDEVDGGIAPGRIIIGGFSQGAALSLYTAATTQKNIGGVIALSSAIPARHSLKSILTERAKTTPIFIEHGMDDQVMSYENAEISRTFMEKELGMQGLEFHAYKDLPHAVNEEELEDVANWLEDILGG